MTNAQRQAKWREKNRALFNLRRRNARKDLSASSSKAVEHPCVRVQGGDSGSTPETQTPTIEALRDLIKREEEKPCTEHPVAIARVYRNDYGNVITQEQWEKLQEKKSEAEKKGYVLDEYSQT